MHPNQAQLFDKALRVIELGGEIVKRAADAKAAAEKSATDSAAKRAEAVDKVVKLAAAHNIQISPEKTAAALTELPTTLDILVDLCDIAATQKSATVKEIGKGVDDPANPTKEAGSSPRPRGPYFDRRSPTPMSA